MGGLTRGLQGCGFRVQGFGVYGSPEPLHPFTRTASGDKRGRFVSKVYAVKGWGFGLGVWELGLKYGDTMRVQDLELEL